MKTIIKIGLGIVFGFILLIGGCAAIVGGVMSSDSGDDKSFAERKAEDREAEATNEETSAEEESSPTKKPKPTPKLTAGQENALAKAEQYLDYSAFSRKGLIEQLEFEDFSTKDATYAVDHVKVNWNEQAAAKAEQYLEMSAYSRQGLIEQLEFEGFTTAQATYGVKQAGL